MTKSTIALVVVLIGMGVAYLVWWTDMFRTPTFQILAQVRPVTPGRGGPGARFGRGGFVAPTPTPGATQTYPVTFAFDRNLKITELKVVTAADEKTSKYPHAVWHLISDNQSSPVKAVIYGQGIRGMKPKVPNAQPEPLQPDVRYRLHIIAGKAESVVDFKTVAVAGSAEADQP
jgi:hypothetical protein